MSDAAVEARVRAAVTRATGRDLRSAPARCLAGHASLRSYWRVGEPPASFVKPPPMVACAALAVFRSPPPTLAYGAVALM